MNIEILYSLAFPILFLLFSGIVIRQALIFANQLWAKTYHHSLSFILLPIVTFVITKAISGNISLSLGMIGALSIVRFRNPVKNPFELVIFFCTITLGIASGVDLKLGIILLITTVFVIIFSEIYSKIKKKKNINVFVPSFEEGYSLNIIEITLRKELKDLNNFNLIYFNYDKDKEIYEYKISERDKSKITEVETLIKNSDAILNYEIRYSFD
jgi:hypothetical protein|tara:strand:- start:146 stop:784 length:639 start_codon:yes stop_codon:yes gene_type:complete